MRKKEERANLLKKIKSHKDREDQKSLWKKKKKNSLQDLINKIK